MFYLSERKTSQTKKLAVSIIIDFSQYFFVFIIYVSLQHRRKAKFLLYVTKIGRIIFKGILSCFLVTFFVISYRIILVHTF
jgi:hypothetical protein